MSGLVSGLQNHVRRFESARYLKSTAKRCFFLFQYILMADNYLEKKMEEHKARPLSRGAVRVKNYFSSLLDKVRIDASFDNFLVREDQMRRIVDAVARIYADIPFCFNIITLDDAARFSLLLGNDIVPVANSYIIISILGDVDRDVYILLGRVQQIMMLQAAEMGLSCAFVDDFDSLPVAREYSLSSLPVSVVAIGRSCKR